MKEDAIQINGNANTPGENIINYYMKASTFFVTWLYMREQCQLFLLSHTMLRQVGLAARTVSV